MILTKTISQACTTFSISIILILSFGCSSTLTDKGRKDIENIREKYGCFEIKTGKGIKTERSGKKTTYINFHFSKCQKELNYDSIQNHPILRQEILETLYSEIKNNVEYDGVNLEFDVEEDELMGNKNYFYLFDKSNKKLILSDSSFVDKF